MINERSLANLKLPKNRTKYNTYRYSLPQEKIDELFTYLAEGQSLKKAAKKAKICFMTARKYFKEGDEKRGIKPLHYRLTIFQDRISEKFNVLLEERRMEMLKTVRKAIDTFSEKIIAGDLGNKPNINHLDKLIRLEVFLSGGVMQKERERKLLSAEEISAEEPGGNNTES